MIIINENADKYKVLREMREKTCFPVINRGKLWYDRLTSEQIEELNSWYEAWLNVTETLVIPETPSFVNEKLQSKEILL